MTDDPGTVGNAVIFYTSGKGPSDDLVLVPGCSLQSLMQQRPPSSTAVMFNICLI